MQGTRNAGYRNAYNRGPGGSLGRNQKGRRACNQPRTTLLGQCQVEEKPWRLGEPEVVPLICGWVGESFWKRFPSSQGRKSITSGRIKAQASVCRERCAQRTPLIWAWCWALEVCQRDWRPGTILSQEVAWFHPVLSCMVATSHRWLFKCIKMK